MSTKTQDDWDPRSDAVLTNQIAAYDAVRRTCPVAHSDYLHWSLFRHADVMRVLQDHESFSSVTSKHLSVPNGMDPPEHGAYRRLIEPYFSARWLDAFKPVCREIAISLVQGLPADGEIELMAQFAQDYALQVQCAFLGWPVQLHRPLRQWIRRNREATLSGSKTATAAVALEFDGYIRDLLEVRRAAGEDAPNDITSDLLQQRIDGRLLDDHEIVSILRNWTVGELGTICACVGILVQYLSERPELQQRLREQPSLLPDAIDEILRLHAPLIANRRVTTCPVEIGGHTLPAGERVTLIWASANRDEAVFGDPDEFRLDRDPADNLLYGAGIHICPGAPLARLELRMIMEELLRHTTQITQVPGKLPVHAAYPSSGFSILPLWVRRASR
jgi:cytochrome P450